jgi:N-acetylmuramoyl-L-alanine amidase
VTRCALIVLLASLPPSMSIAQSITVRDGTTSPVSLADSAGVVAFDALARALRARLTVGEGRAALAIGSTLVTVTEGSRFVVVGDRVVTVPSPVLHTGDRWLLPRAFVTDVLPRTVSGLLFDPEASELRRFGAAPVARAPSPPPPRVASAASSAPAVERPAVSEPGASAPRTLSRRHVVVVDAGHGGQDPGMSGPIGSGPKVQEKRITLAVSLALREALVARGVSVVMTRTRDTLIALADRGKIANQAKGDLFVSIHVNAANPRWREPGAARGFETYFLAEAKTEDERRVAAMENEVVRFETAAETSSDDPLGFLLRDMAQNEHLRESSELAQEVQSRIGSVHPGSSRGVKQAGFRVLVGAFMPAVLVEIGFGTNPGDAGWMATPARQKELANVLADAVLTYLARYDRKVGASNGAGR